MKNIIVEIRMTSLVIVMIICFVSCKPNTEKVKSEFKNEGIRKVNAQKLNSNQFVSELERLEYFKLTDTERINDVKSDLINILETNGFFLTKTEDESLKYLDNRFYSIDSEELFEIGGLTIYLQLVQSSFDKLGLPFVLGKEVSEEDGNNWKHTIEINGREYTAFNGPFNDNVWEIAYANFIMMLNEELAYQGSDEKFYAIRSANDGSIVLLTNQQFFLITNTFLNARDNPIELNDWKNAIQLSAY